MKQYTFWSDNEINMLKQYSGKISFREMIKYFTNRTPISLQKKAIKLGLISNYRFTKWSYNKNYWKELNLINCYYGGFIAADGNLKSKDKVLIISLNPKDISILENFSKEVKYNGPIKKYQREKYKSEEMKDVCTLTINQGNEWYKDLFINFNITPKKSKTLSPPNINNHYLEMAYIQGLVDGDGWIITKTKNNRVILGFVSSSKKLIEWVYNKFKKLINQDFPEIYENKGKTYYYFTINDIKAAILINYMRKFPIYCRLSRKWDKPLVLQYIEQKKKENPSLFIEPDQSELSKYLPTNNLNI